MLRTRTRVIVSEPDVEAALDHLRALPFAATGVPRAWNRTELLNDIRSAVGLRPKIGDAFAVAPGVFAVIKPFAVDLAGLTDRQGRLQVWLAIRTVGTDPTRVVEL